MQNLVKLLPLAVGLVILYAHEWQVVKQEDQHQKQRENVVSRTWRFEQHPVNARESDVTPEERFFLSGLGEVLADAIINQSCSSIVVSGIGAMSDCDVVWLDIVVYVA